MGSDENEEPDADPEWLERVLGGIQERPAFWVGSTRFLGFSNYLISSIQFSLTHGATRLEFLCDGDEYAVRSDADLCPSVHASGMISPIERNAKWIPWDRRVDRCEVDGPILVALSEYLDLDVVSGGDRWALRFEVGKRVQFQRAPDDREPEVQMRFRPRRDVFNGALISPGYIQSYLSRMSHLHPGVSFTATLNNETTHYCSQGMVDLLSAISQPFQHLHKPIHLKAQEGDLELELVFVFHAWTNTQILSFINRGRIPGGGAHEDGLRDAFKALPERLGMSLTRAPVPGILAVLSLCYPGVPLEGAMKHWVGGNTLRPCVKRLVLESIEPWMDENPSEVARIRELDEFRWVDLQWL